jgi:hypothetical protein
MEELSAIAAELAEGDRQAPAILAARGLSAVRWEQLSALWMRRIALDADEGEGALGEAWSSAFAAAQDKLKPVPALTPEAWAELTLDVARRGPAAALGARGLTNADHQRLARHWTRALSRDQALALRHAEAFYAEERRFSEASRAGAALPSTHGSGDRGLATPGTSPGSGGAAPAR